MTDALVETVPAAIARRFDLVVVRKSCELPSSVVRLTRVSLGTAGAFVVGFAVLFGWPEALFPIAPYVAGLGIAAIGLGVAARVSSRRSGAPVRAARAWEQRFLKAEARGLAGLLTDRERILDYCAVLAGHAPRYAPFGLYVLTNVRVFVTKGSGRRLRAQTNVPLRVVQSVAAGPTGTLDDAGDFLDQKKGTGLLTVEYGVRRRLHLIMPTTEEARSAYEAMLDAMRDAPVAERGALAIAEPNDAGALAVVDEPPTSD